VQCANNKGRANLYGISVGRGFPGAIGKGGQFARVQLERDDCTYIFNISSRTIVCQALLHYLSIALPNGDGDRCSDITRL